MQTVVTLLIIGIAFWAIYFAAKVGFMLLGLLLRAIFRLVEYVTKLALGLLLTGAAG